MESDIERIKEIMSSRNKFLNSTVMRYGRL